MADLDVSIKSDYRGAQNGIGGNESFYAGRPSMFLLVDFLVKNVILLFTRSADTTDRASDKHRHADRYQDSRQKIA